MDETDRSLNTRFTDSYLSMLVFICADLNFGLMFYRE
jgi:hypothetical protein